ncbi:hypothetical protein KKP04_02320 [Rhodomicrobium sp. Az07]|uniref:hypothetical protein n=1 Tax=Rhodomicrobium sp. Az07 TaxID=2839034 RepID=UPI001BEABEDC|nr:hypothetical protein [Rhodomicrobium sp. Az07]MBT3069705.1 hypothetical protein [Rhodomicrobium sp. Az07]
MPNILVDTGIWLALCDSKDTSLERDEIEDLFDRIGSHTIILPWPVLFETLRTKFVKNRNALGRFEQEIKSSKIKIFDDARYRESALDHSIRSSKAGRHLSMVDCLLRLMIEDPSIKIKYLATLNVRDFSDVCRTRNVEIWPT